MRDSSDGLWAYRSITDKALGVMENGESTGA